MVEYLQYNIHNFDMFLDAMYEKFICDIDDVNMLHDDVKFTAVVKRFIKSSTLEVLIEKSCKDMSTSVTNIIAVCDTDWMSIDRPYIDSTKFYKLVISSINSIKRLFPVLIKKFKCDFINITQFLMSIEGNMVQYQLESDYRKLKKGMTFKKLKNVMVENGLQYVYNSVLTKNEVQKLLIL